MIKYPSDSFYRTHSLHIDLNRSGKDEYNLMKKRLTTLGINPNNETAMLSLDVLQEIHGFVLKHGKSERKRRLQHIRKNQTTSGVIPIDISIATDIFHHLMNSVEPYYTATLILFGLKNKIWNLIKIRKPKDQEDKDTNSIIKKLLETDKEGVVIKKIIEIKVKKSSKRNPRSKKKSNKNKRK